jgi:competence protein ComEC
VTAPSSGAVGLDLRLVPAALTCWSVTAAGILWGPWASACVLAVAVAATASVGWWMRRRTSEPAAVWPGVLAVAVVGVAFAIAVGLRVHDLRQHPIVSRYGATATVTVTPGESLRFLGGARLLFRG